jgi:Trypsin
MRPFLLLLVVACGPSADVGSSSQPVVGGYFDTSAGPTVAIFRCNGTCAFTPYLNPLEICSGTLIAPNLILTARHCVAPEENSSEGVLCSETTFDAPYAADNFIATPADNVNAGGPWFIAREVDVSGQDGDLVCGNDLAVLQLRDPYLGATPMVPRITQAPMAGETYSAIGYGDDLDGGIGYRHRRDGLHVMCVGTACTLIGLDDVPAVTEAELEGQTGLCGGDSGGPAVDANGLLFGVTSRADASKCDRPVYSRVDSHAAWLQAQAVTAASWGGYELPAWAYASLPDDAGTDGAVEADAPIAEVDASPTADASIPVMAGQATGGCSTSTARPSFGLLLLLLVGGALRRATKRP